MTGYAASVRGVLEQNGCRFDRHGRDDHDIWRSLLVSKPFTVPVRIDSRHTANKILRDAGLPKAF